MTDYLSLAQRMDNMYHLDQPPEEFYAAADAIRAQAARIAELEAALEEQHRHHLKLELEKRAVEDIAEQFSKDKAEYYRYIRRLEAALKPFADYAKNLDNTAISVPLFGIEDALRAARAAMEGKND